MATTWNTERWDHKGVNEAGDTVYERNTQAGDKTVPSEELTKAELQAQLEARGLPTSGTKAELVERLAG